MKICLTFILIILLTSCVSDKNEQKEISYAQSKTAGKGIPNQLNITILLDLSDRISPEKHPNKPEHFERDISIVKYFTELFVKDMEKRGTFLSKGKMKVIFSPAPDDPNINILADKLSVDLSKMDSKQKKEVYDNISSIFSENISKIYNTTIAQSKWIGSDIWRFFKNDIKDYCVDKNKNYRNILILVTDGYLYHKDSEDIAGNRYAYLLPKNITRFNLRGNPNWQEIIETNDFGLITKRNDLQNLEVLVLEVSPSSNFKNDEDIIKNIIAKWFKEMNVQRFAIYNSDLPEYTKQRIDDFISP